MDVRVYVMYSTEWSIGFDKDKKESEQETKHERKQHAYSICMGRGDRNRMKF